jgi:hypothetical protein
LRPIAAEWPLLKVQRSVASQDNEWRVPAAAVIGLQNLAGCSQPQAAMLVDFSAADEADRWRWAYLRCLVASSRSAWRRPTTRKAAERGTAVMNFAIRLAPS